MNLFPRWTKYFTQALQHQEVSGRLWRTAAKRWTYLLIGFVFLIMFVYLYTLLEDGLKRVFGVECMVHKKGRIPDVLIGGFGARVGFGTCGFCWV